MILTKQQIKALKKEHAKAEKAANLMASAEQGMACLIEEFTGIVGFCDHLQGDGFGFTPESNNDTHIPIDHLLKHAENGIDITEEFINKNRSI